MRQLLLGEGGSKSTFSLSHTKVGDAKAVAQAKKEWKARLTALRETLEMQ